MIYKFELLYTLIIIVVLIGFRVILESVIAKRILSNQFNDARKKILLKILNVGLIMVGAIGLISIWGVNKNDILFFVSGALSLLGVAFFAQWSHLSNITAGLIIFFSSTTRIGDRITIMDKDFDFTGEIEDIETFYVKIRTDKGELLSIPNNILLQKPMKVEDSIHSQHDTLDDIA